MSETRVPDHTADAPPDSSNAVLGMGIFLVSLSILFAATMVGYIVVRLRAEQWPPPGTPALPWTMWLSTAILIGCSFAIHRALIKVRSGEQPALRRAMMASLILGILFLLVQTLNWAQLIQAQMTVRSSLYAFTFYTLTGLHALHVIAGVIQLEIVTRRTWRGIYTPESHLGIRLSAMYWHFLDAVWLVMFLCLMALS